MNTRIETSTQSNYPISVSANAHPAEEFFPRSVSAFMRSTCRPGLLLLAAASVLLLTSLAAAQTLTGTLRNASTGKPAAGDEVILIKLAQGMEEAGRTRTDSKGQFT
ncbi:MAG: hypothetical protein QOF94_1990, partial [Acidobacteriaceae bacterium]